MAIPDFQTIMLPLLRLTADGAEHTLIATVQAVADEFQLSPEERTQPLPHANQTTIYNRVAWASSYLRYALLLTSTGRGRFRITARGQTVLASPPQRIGIPYLLQFAEFKAFRERAGKETTPALSVVGVESAESQTPEEAIASSYGAFRASVEQELLDRVKAASHPDGESSDITRKSREPGAASAPACRWWS